MHTSSPLYSCLGDLTQTFLYSSSRRVPNLGPTSGTRGAAILYAPGPLPTLRSIVMIAIVLHANSPCFDFGSSKLAISGSLERDRDSDARSEPAGVGSRSGLFSVFLVRASSSTNTEVCISGVASLLISCKVWSENESGSRETKLNPLSAALELQRTLFGNNIMFPFRRVCLASRPRLSPGRRSLHALIGLQRNHYDVLGLNRTASREEVKAAFVALSKKYHPDLNPNLHSTGKSFVEINEAYSVLSSAVRRREYDRELHTAETYRAEVFSNSRANPAYAGSGPRQTGSSSSRGFYNTANPFTHGGSYDYGFHEEEIDWEAYKKARRPKHTKVVLSIVALMSVATAIQSLRIHWAHKYFQERSDVEMRRNETTYQQVRERAENSSVQEQLELLSKRYFHSQQKFANAETDNSTVR